jgi:UDP-N-acetylglucosamine/UDP-N-acetylgalactosamine diphosphorylase
MTSPATHAETLRFLEQNERFGLPAADIQVFCQGTMPAVDAETGRLLLAEKGRLFLSPDGHGGMLRAMEQQGCLADARRRGIEHLFYGQVDNPLTQICDPELIGYHISSRSEMTTQVVRKREPLERVGNLVRIDGQVRIIEYSDLPDEVACRRAADGSLRLWAGNMAVHIFTRGFLERAASRPETLPWHRARKVTPHLDEEGNPVSPAAPNAFKFERFIFDLLPLAKNALAVEADKAEAFAPVKNDNSQQADSPATAQAAMVALHARWLRQAGAEVPDGVPVEISPLWALDAEEVARKLPAGTIIEAARFFGPEPEDDSV